MKTTIFAIAATILVASPNLTLAQDSQSGEELLLPGDQEAPKPDKKKRQEKAQELLKKKQQEKAEQRKNKNQDADQADQADQQPQKKQKAQQQGDQPDQAGQEQDQKLLKKMKKKDQAGSDQPPQPEQAEESAPTEPVAEQPPQPEKTKKKAEERKNRDAEPAQAEQNPPKPAEKQAEPQQGAPTEAAEFLADKRGAHDLSDAELKSRVLTGRSLAKNEKLSRKQRQQAQEMSKQAAAELLRREKSGQAQTEQPVDPEQPKPEKPAVVDGQEPPQPDKPKSQAEREQAKELDGNKGSPEAEAKAQDFLRDRDAAERMNDEELRQRLESMRALLAENQLSGDSERALRGQLQTEREVLRSRVTARVEQEQRAKREKEQQQAKNQGEQGKQGRDRRARRNFDDWDANDVLRDRRGSDELEEGELRRRIDVYRDAANDDRYDEGNRRYWRETMERDRRALRGRMIADRSDRADEYRSRRGRDGSGFDININVDLDDDRPDSIFIDEADDEELEEQLVAAPRRKISRRYSVEEIEDDPEIREAMPAIEIDTVRFGFNEAFVREEEVDRLDRIAEVIEKILATHPGEVFMIEGHTDAVGSDSYNLNLSRERAKAVKEALSTFYVIPARNLQTVGYGERYLKIPTAEPEQENRRVTLRRVTPLVGEALDD